MHHIPPAALIGVFVVAVTLIICFLALTAVSTWDLVVWFFRRRAAAIQMRKDHAEQDRLEHEARILRIKREREARNTFLTDPVFGRYSSGFDKTGEIRPPYRNGVKLTGDAADEYYRKLDETADTGLIKVYREDV